MPSNPGFLVIDYNINWPFLDGGGYDEIVKSQQESMMLGAE